MITTVNIEKQDIEEMIEKALSEYESQHNKGPRFLILGRLAYEEFRTMQKLSGIATITDAYKGLDIAVIEEPTNALVIGCKPD